MTTGTNAASSFGNPSKGLAFNRHMALVTGRTSGSAPLPLTPTFHPGRCCCCRLSPSGSGGRPSTPLPNSSWVIPRPETVRQLMIKSREQQGTGGRS